MKQTIELSRRNSAAHFEARNPDGNTVSIDGSSAIGGEGKGMRPMELALTALAACASLDVGPILLKQRQTVDDIRVSATGNRVEGTPAPFSSVELHFVLSGAIEPAKARRAVDLAVHKYCSVGAMLEQSVDIAWRLTVNGEAVA